MEQHWGSVCRLRAQWQQFWAGMKPLTPIKATGLALQIHKANMMFKRKSRRERRRTSSQSTALLYHPYKTEMKEPGERRRGNLPFLMSPFPPRKWCITENPVHLFSRHAAMLWSSFAYFILFFKCVQLYDEALAHKERFVLALQSASSCFLLNWQSEQLEGGS